MFDLIEDQFHELGTDCITVCAEIFGSISVNDQLQLLKAKECDEFAHIVSCESLKSQLFLYFNTSSSR